MCVSAREPEHDGAQRLHAQQILCLVFGFLILQQPFGKSQLRSTSRTLTGMVVPALPYPTDPTTHSRKDSTSQELEERIG